MYTLMSVSIYYRGTRAGPWREEHEFELRELFDRYKSSDGE